MKSLRVLSLNAEIIILPVTTAVSEYIQNVLYM